MWGHSEALTSQTCGATLTSHDDRWDRGRAQRTAWLATSTEKGPFSLGFAYPGRALLPFTMFISLFKTSLYTSIHTLTASAAQAHTDSHSCWKHSSQSTSFSEPSLRGVLDDSRFLEAAFRAGPATRACTISCWLHTYY